MVVEIKTSADCDAPSINETYVTNEIESMFPGIDVEVKFNDRARGSLSVDIWDMSEAETAIAEKLLSGRNVTDYIFQNLAADDAIWQ